MERPVRELTMRMRRAVDRDSRDAAALEDLLHEAVIALHLAEAEVIRLQREIEAALDRDAVEVAELTRSLRAASMVAAAVREPERRLREHYERVLADRAGPR